MQDYKNFQQISRGDRLKIDPFSEIAEVLHFEPSDTRFTLIVKFLPSGKAETLIFSPEEFKERVHPIPSIFEKFADRALKQREPFILYTEALRFRLAYTFDPHYAVSVTQVDLLPHQIDAVYRRVLPMPKVRFLLADDPGLGKTIEAGLILKELKARGLVERYLVVVPAHLIDQWRREFREWFREDLSVLPKDTYLADSFFERNPSVITSMDFAKREPYREILARQSWDLVIVDEAHKLSVSKYGQKEKKTRRFVLGEALSPRTVHMLFLTATPHKGDDYAYFRLLSLLEPRLFLSPEHLKQAASTREISFVLRRSKEQVVDKEGRPLFKPRYVETISVSLSPDEKLLYDAVTNYVKTWYKRISGRKDRKARNVALGLIVLQRRLASSVNAIKNSLIRRKNRLNSLLSDWEKALIYEQDLPDIDDETLEEYQDSTEKEREAFEERVMTLTAAETPDELRSEIKELEGLIQYAERVARSEKESKLIQLKGVVDRYLKDNPDEKLLVFTEFKDTLYGLVENFESWGYRVAVIHGGMPMDQRIEEERKFRDETQVMVATDAAGEGLNLQFCRLMINYDLPWNPNRLEQRMGRIHRYGQKKKVFVFNLIYDKTIEGRVLKKLLDKLALMRERLGDSVFDVINEILRGVRLEDRIMEAILSGESEPLENWVDAQTESSFEQFKKALEEYALAGEHINLSEIQKEEPRSKINRIVPWDVERFTLFALKWVGGTFSPDRRNPRVFRISIPRIIQKQYNLPESFVKGIRVAFEREVARNAKPQAEFLAPGHPLFEVLCDHFLENDSPPQKAVLIDPDGNEGSLWIFRSRVVDGNGFPVLERLHTYFFDRQKGEIYSIDPRKLWDLRSIEGDIDENLAIDMNEELEEVKKKVLDDLDRIYEEALERRKREAEIKKRHYEMTYSTLIRESNEKLLDYTRREMLGEDVRLAKSEEDKRLRALIKEKEEKLSALKRERTLTRTDPELVAVALVIPPSKVKRDPKLKDVEELKRQVEMAGMAFVMEYESNQGRKPLDVSKEFLGYDILSSWEKGDERGTRYIEVKSFKDTGPLELTSHEWQMAERLREDYWVYVVENALQKPKLTKIRDPVGTFREYREKIIKIVIDKWKEEAK